MKNQKLPKIYINKWYWFMWGQIVLQKNNR